MLSNKLFSSIGNTDRLYVDDVFSAYTYTGNGTTQTINNGIDLAGKGGLVWLKRRGGAVGNYLFDTMRGANKALISNSTGAEFTAASTLTAFSGTGFSLGSSGDVNTTDTFVSWTFRKAPKFFDVQTKVHTTGTPSTIDLSTLGVVGMITVKSTVGTSDWFTWHKDLTAGNNLTLNLTDAQSTTNAYLSVSGTTLTIASTAPSDTYIVYSWAHDTDADGMIQCGSLSAMPSAVSLGWEPQFLLIKCTDSTSDWRIYDTMRNWKNNTAPDSRLRANLSGAEQTLDDFGEPTATGFNVRNEASDTYIYLAIRRSNKPPTTGTEVYNAIAFTGNSTGSTKQTLATSFPPDTVLLRNWRSSTTDIKMYDRLRGDGNRLRTNLSNAHGLGGAAWNSFTSSMQFTVGPAPEDNPGYSGGESVAWAFKRAPGFFDVVCYTGTGAASQLISHSLAVSPELVIIKRLNGADSWWVYASSQAQLAILNQTDNFGFGPAGRFSGVSASTFTISSDGGFGANGGTYVAYLFASLPGISKVGSYTGNGSSQTINCGFSTGARFILLKRTDSTGDWYVWDTARGIIAANDPHLSLNTTAAEVTTNDSVDPDSTGFIVNQVAATNINVNGATYIFLSIA